MKMEHITDAVNHQSLESQQADETNELTTITSSDGTSVCSTAENTYSSNNPALVIKHRTMTYSPVPTLCSHDVVDDHNVVAQTVVTAGGDNISENASPFVMVRTIIDGLSHSPVHSTFQKTISLTARNQHGEPLQMEQDHNHEQSQHYQLLTSHRQLLQLKNLYQTLEQQQYQGLENRLHGCSPMDFVGSSVKLDELSACSSPNSNVSNILDINQEVDKALITDEHGIALNDRNCNTNAGNCSNIYDDVPLLHSKENKSCSDVTQIESNVNVELIDDISSKEVEVVLNHHHHHNKYQQELLQGQLSQQHVPSKKRRNGDPLTYHSHTARLQGQQLLINEQEAVSATNQHRRTKNHQPQQTCYHNDPIKHSESFSVIVQQQKGDSRDSGSELLSPELGIVNVGIVSDQPIQPVTYHPLPSENGEISPPEFSPPSSYATLTPLQPLPPISTMSEKFAYGGHINGGGLDMSGGGGTNSSSNSSSESVEVFTTIPNQNSLGALSLGSLGGVQSPYSSYDKLPSMGISMSPPQNYATSPSHTLHSMVIACELRTAPTSPCGAPSPQATYDHSTELHSPTQSACKSSRRVAMAVDCDSNSNLSNGTTSLQIHHRGTHKQISLSQTVTSGNDTTDNIIMADFESPYSTHQRKILVTSTPISATRTAGQSSSVRLHRSPILSPDSISRKSVPLNILGSYRTTNQVAVTLPPLNSETPTSLDSNDIVSMSPSHHNAIAGSLTPSPPPENMITCSTSVSNHQTATYMHMQEASITQESSQQYKQSEKYVIPVTSDSNLNANLNGNLNLNLGDVLTEEDMVPNIKNRSIVELQGHQPAHHESQNELFQTNIHYITNSNSPSNSSSGSIKPQSATTTAGSSNISSVGGADGGSVVGGSNGGAAGSSDLEEINTKDLAHRISAELKRYSIPQAIFAQRVLCRSQGTLSDLLRNPKPWSKLKSGRETFRRMHKWLQEPEYQRMSALRIAAAQIPHRMTNTNTINGTITTSNRVSNSCTGNIVHANNSNGGNPRIEQLNLNGSSTSIPR